MSVGYLLASLPMLLPEREPGISAEAFIQACSDALSAADAEAARILVLGSDAPSTHEAVRAWRDLESAVDGAVGRRRLARRSAGQGANLGGADFAAPETSLCPLWLVRRVEAAFESAPDPLAREEALMRVRWSAAEELGGCDPMAKAQVFAYAIKLRLALRRAALDLARGRARLEAALPTQTLGGEEV